MISLFLRSKQFFRFLLRVPLFMVSDTCFFVSVKLFCIGVHHRTVPCVKLINANYDTELRPVFQPDIGTQLILSTLLILSVKYAGKLYSKLCYHR